MSKASAVNISIGSNEEVSVIRKKSYRSTKMPNYRRIGIMKEQDEKDILDLLGSVSKASFQMYIHLKSIRDEQTNFATLASAGSPSESVMQNRALRELMDADLLRKVKTTQLKTPDLKVVRVPRRTYMINPAHLFPRSNEDFELATFYWEQLA